MTVLNGLTSVSEELLKKLYTKAIGWPSPLLSPQEWTAVTVFWPARLRVYWTDSSQCSTLQHVFCATGGSTTTSLRSYVTSSTGYQSRSASSTSCACSFSSHCTEQLQTT